MSQPTDRRQGDERPTGNQSAPAAAASRQSFVPSDANPAVDGIRMPPGHDRSGSGEAASAGVDAGGFTTRNARFSLPDAVTVPLEHLWRPRTATTLPDSPTVADLPATARSAHSTWRSPWERYRAGSRTAYRPGQAPDARAERHALIGLLASIGVVLLIVVVAFSVVLIQLARLGATSASQQSGPQSVTGHAPRPTPTATATRAPAPTATSAPANGAIYVTTDTTTLGSWQGVYGAAGYVTVGDAQQLPPTIQVTPANASQYVWAGSTNDPRGVQKAATPDDHIAACWYSPTSFTIDITIADGQTYQLALYLMDWDHLQRAQTVDLLDPTSNTLLNSQSVTAFSGGEYLVWQVRGHIMLRISNDPGAVNAVVSAIFFAHE